MKEQGYPLKEEELNNVSGGRRPYIGVYIQCVNCGALLKVTPPNGICPSCHLSYRKPQKPAKLD